MQRCSPNLSARHRPSFRRAPVIVVSIRGSSSQLLTLVRRPFGLVEAYCLPSSRLLTFASKLVIEVTGVLLRGHPPWCVTCDSKSELCWSAGVNQTHNCIMPQPLPSWMCPGVFLLCFVAFAFLTGPLLLIAIAFEVPHCSPEHT